MNGWKWAAGLCAASAMGYLCWQRWELSKFAVTNYEIASVKVKKEHRIVVLADLHGFSYGPGNRRLLKAIRKLQPELILIAGDMIVSKYPQTYDKALDTLRGLVKIAPVYYGCGNHESRAASRPAVAEAFGKYRREAERLGVVFLANRTVAVELKGDSLAVSGLELSLRYYVRGHIRPLKEGYLTEALGKAPRQLTLLLAHNPAYSEEYAAWGADVAFCGHNHGGLVRIPGLGGIISPQMTLFPKYGEGIHRLHGRHVIISRGLGTHTFHVRIFNRAELVCLDVLPRQGQTFEKQTFGK